MRNIIAGIPISSVPTFVWDKVGNEMPKFAASVLPHFYLLLESLDNMRFFFISIAGYAVVTKKIIEEDIGKYSYWQIGGLSCVGLVSLYGLYRDSVSHSFTKNFFETNDDDKQRNPNRQA